MVNFTEKEKKALLILLKDINNFYNSNTLSKKLNISRVGSMKILKKLEKKNILKKINVGKTIIYKINLENGYARDMISFLLSDEANNYNRWKNEFNDLFLKDKIIIFYGSASVNYAKANDIDLMIIGKINSSINKIISEKQKILPKKIHLINITEKEFLENLEKKQESIIEIIRTGIILYGQNKYVELLKNVKSI